MLFRKDNVNAIRCFKQIGRFDLVERIEASELSEKAEHQLYRLKI
jgi:hypothetical protein